MHSSVSACWIWRHAVQNLQRLAAGEAVVKMAPPAVRMVNAVLVMTLVVLKPMAVALLDTSAVKGRVSSMMIL